MDILNVHKLIYLIGQCRYISNDCTLHRFRSQAKLTFFFLPNISSNDWGNYFFQCCCLSEHNDNQEDPLPPITARSRFYVSTGVICFISRTIRNWYEFVSYLRARPSGNTWEYWCLFKRLRMNQWFQLHASKLCMKQCNDSEETSFPSNSLHWFMQSLLLCQPK